MRSSILLLLVVAAGFSAACGSTVVEEDDDDVSTCEGAGCAEACPAQRPSEGDSCDLADFETCSYGGTTDCTKVYRCEPVYPEAGAPSKWAFFRDEGHGCAPCDGESCAAGDVEVETCPSNASCYEVSGCSGSIVCMSAGCSDPPVCDAGDVEVSDCPADASCYVAQACGGSILCADVALPEHGCPPAPPASGEACDELDKICNYPTMSSCFETHICQGSSGWSFIGGGCM